MNASGNIATQDVERPKNGSSRMPNERIEKMKGWATVEKQKRTKKKTSPAVVETPKTMMPDDWLRRFSTFDQVVYKFLLKRFPSPASPEDVLEHLTRAGYDATIENIWKALDSKAMKTYVIRSGKCDWTLKKNE